jgi:hypothetical protein
MPVLTLPSRIRLRCRSPYGGERTYAACCLSGTGASSGRRGEDTRPYCLPPVPGPARPGQAESAYRPLAGGKIACTSPRPASTGRVWRSRQREVKQALAVPAPNGGLPCPCGDMPSVDGPGSSPGKGARRGPRSGRFLGLFSASRSTLQRGPRLGLTEVAGAVAATGSERG